MADIALLVVPYELGRLREGVGNGRPSICSRTALETVAAALWVLEHDDQEDEQWMVSTCRPRND